MACFLVGISADANNAEKKAKKKSLPESAQFRAPISNDEKMHQALNRLTFGPRPGDVAQVRAMGLKKWIDRELHPERIPENPLLDAKLRPLESLTMSPAQMEASYPSPQRVKAMVEGKLPFPDGPDKRMMIRRLVAHYEGKADQPGGGQPPGPDLAALLPPERLRVFSSRSPKKKIALFASLPPDRQDQVLEAIGQGTRAQLFAAA